jgi:hypothetical protein
MQAVINNPAAIAVAASVIALVLGFVWKESR